MADLGQYNAKTILMDVTYTKMGQNVPLNSPLSGYSQDSTGASYAEVTLNSINSCTLDTGYAADAYILEVTPPVVSTNGVLSYPDVQITFLVDGKPQSNYQVIDGSYNSNMFPRAVRTYLGAQRTLGISTKAIADKIIKAGSRGLSARLPKNPLLKMTGLKGNQSYAVTVTSQAGWGAAGQTVITPLRVVLRGDLWGTNEFALYGSALSALNGINNIEVAKDGLNAFAKTYAVPAVFDTKSFVTLPGGRNQGNIKINKVIKYASNAQAIGVSGNYAFTNIQSLKGNPGNVTNTDQDLGDNFIDSNNFFDYEYLGIRMAQGVFGSWGFLINGSIVPLTTQNGYPVSYGTNDFQWGQVQPQLSESDLYFPLPDVKNLVDMSVFQAGITPFFSGVGNTAPIAAGDVTIMKGGVLVEA